MLTEVTTAANALEGFATHLDGYWTDQPFVTQVGGWHTVPLSRQDLASRVRKLSERLRAIPDVEIDGELIRKLNSLPDQISYFQNNTLPQIQGGNLPSVISIFEILMSNIEQSIPLHQTTDWEEVSKSNLIPRALANRIRTLEAGIARLIPRADELDEKLKRIDEAHLAASELPTDLIPLQEARDEIKRFSEESKIYMENIENSVESSILDAQFIAGQKNESIKLIENINTAYSAATTVGLAASFTERAGRLNTTTWIWVALLIVALATGGLLGAHRLDALQEMAKEDPQSHWIWLNATMSLLSIAAPIWFAWLATRQIGQRFRLSEDYAFKASMARAYEGYRKEAARLDPKLEARLFSSALDRLEEAPLRFLAIEEHGSPYEALLASPGFQRALEKFPNLRETATSVLDRAAAVVRTTPADPPTAV